jgi:hypothetical protein
MSLTQWYGGTPRSTMGYDEATRIAHLLDASRRRAAELELMRRSPDTNPAEIVNETLDELWCALDILNDAVATLQHTQSI